MLDPAYPFTQPADREVGDFKDKAPTDAKKAERMASDSRRLSSLRQTIKRWDNRAKAKGYDTILECLDAAPVKE